MKRSPSVEIQYSQFSMSATWIFHWSNFTNLGVATEPAPMAILFHLMYTPNSFWSSASLSWNHVLHCIAMPQSVSAVIIAFVHWSSALFPSPSSVCLNVFHHTWYLNFGVAPEVAFVTMICTVTPRGQSGMRRSDRGRTGRPLSPSTRCVR